MQLDKKLVESAIEQHYHDTLKFINKVYNHPLMGGTPGLRQELTNATNSLTKLRDLTRERML